MIDFRKLRIIFKREYLTRLRTKAFIITTVLIPIGFLLIMLLPIGMQLLESDTQFRVAVVDRTYNVLPRLQQQNSNRYFNAADQPIDSLRQQVIDERINGYIEITDEHIESNTDPELIYSGGGGISVVSNIEDEVRSAIRDERLDRAQVTDEIRDILQSRPDLATRKLTSEGEQEADTTFMFLFGYVMAFVIYGAMFGYGGLVMRGVIEEKTNRIIEVVTSSVKPMELLLGKVLGIGALGLTQFLIWITASIAIMSGLAPLLTLVMGSEMSTSAGASGASEMPVPDLPTIAPSIWIYFIIFFLLGYLIYSAMFAAIGSAVDSETDTQQLTIPVLIPVIIAMVLIPKVASDPDSTLSVIASLIPFFSPILMVARIPITDVPFWQIGLDIVLMIITFLGVMWLSSKIYRVGILMYGKKPSFREIARWVRYR